VIRGIQPEPVPTRRLFTVSAAAQYLGISDDTLRKYADLGLIPVHRFINGHRAFKLEDLNRLIDNLPRWDDAQRDMKTCAGREGDIS
jgi:excisionase family DNA binding protein